jgi:hypothetical protein
VSSDAEDLDAWLVVALQESEQLPGDHASQTPFDVAAAVALGGAPGNVGAGVGVGPQAHQQDGVQGAVELPVPAPVAAMAGHLPRRRRDRVGAGEGGNRGSDRNRPACDQLISTCAALSGPTPGTSSSQGATAWTRMDGSAWSWSAAACRCWMRWAVARRARTVARCSSDLLGRSRRLAQVRIWLEVGRLRSSARSSSGAPTISASGLADRGHPGGGGAGSGGQQRPQRFSLAAPARDRGTLVVLAERLTGGPHGIQRVAFGAAAGGWPLGSADLHDVLAALDQEAGQAGAVAAGALHRPAPPPDEGEMGLGEAEQLHVADGVGGGGCLGEDAAEVGDGGGGEGVAVGVDADDTVDQCCQHWHAVVLLGRGRPRCRRRPGRSHRAAEL